jgi:hypothetical protein
VRTLTATAYYGEIPRPRYSRQVSMEASFPTLRRWRKNL